MDHILPPRLPIARLLGEYNFIALRWANRGILMLGWIIVLFIISITSAIFAFAGFAEHTAFIAKIAFLTFSVLFVVAVFVFLGTRNAMKK